MTTSHRTGPVRRPVALAVVLLLAVAACSGSSSADGGGQAAVEITGNQYQPAQLEVATGDTVTWTNSDAVPHTVTFTDGDVASSDQLAEGEEFSATFDAPGTYAYVCAVHPEMEATVTVSG